MSNWKKPVVICYNMKLLARSIKAKAWSVGAAMAVGQFLDECNQGDIGTVYMDPDNPGYTIQVEVIGHVIGGIIILMDILTGDRYEYSNENGVWERKY